MDRGNRLIYDSIGNIDAKEGTIELWMKPSWDGNDGQSHAIFRYGNTVNLLLGKEGNNLRLALNRGNSDGSLELDALTNIQAWQANQWHHVAASWSNSGKFLRLYVDGTLMSERSLAPKITLPTIDPAFNTTLQLGGDSVRSPLLATIDEVAITGGAPRSSQEIATRMLQGIPLTNARVTPPSINAITLYPGWTHWQNLQFTINTTISSAAATLNVPWLAATLSYNNQNKVAKTDPVTGRIQAVAAGTETVTATLNGVPANVIVTVLPRQQEPVVETTIDMGLATVNTAPYKIPVAIIRYFPTINGMSVDTTVAGALATPNIDALKTKLTGIEKNVKYMLEEGSRFRGYTDVTIKPSLGYQVVKIINVFEEVPPGLPTAASNVYYPDYKQIFTHLNVQDLVMNQGVKEIWLEQYVNGRITLNESNMASPVTGDVSSSLRTNDDLPVYDKQYTVFGINYAEDENTAARNHGHHLEAVLTYVNVRQDNVDTLFQEQFIGRKGDGTFNPGRCGKTDKPPNYTAQFPFNNSAPVDSDIADWFPEGGFVTQVTGDTWSSLPYAGLVQSNSQLRTEDQWYIYWMQAIPGLDNFITRFDTERLTNWWQFVGDWDTALQNKVGLTKALFCIYTLSSTSQNIIAGGGSGSVTVTVGPGCAWTATSNAGWLKLNDGSRKGVGTGTVGFTVDANLGARQTGTLTIQGQTFTVTQDGTNPLPTITSLLSPLNATAGGAAFTLTVTGTNFTTTSVVNWNGAARTTTFNSATQLQAAITAADIAAAIPVAVTVTNPTPGGGTTATALNFVINNPAPTLASLTPTSAVAGSAGFTLTLNGTGFVAASVAQVNNISRTTTFVSGTQLTINLTAADIANAATMSVAVFNPTPVGGPSGTQTLTINNPLPTLTSLSQTAATIGSAGLTLTVNGTNFVSTSKVRWKGNDRTTAFVTATQLTAVIPASDLTSMGTADVTVFNPLFFNPLLGGGTTSPLTFTITAACTYALSQTSQNFAAAGGNSSLNVTTGAGCAWAASSNAAWLTITAGNSGNGIGTVSFTAAANLGAERTGTLTVAGQTFTARQDALACVAQRTLPATGYIPNQALAVSVQITPTAGTQSYAVEETPPAGWTVSGINNGGVFDAVNGKVKWGPFFDAQALTLGYSVTPPVGITGTKAFTGAASINGVGSAICGNASLDPGSLFHQADLNNNLKIDINELTAYGAAWKAGTAWSRPPSQIDINYLTNAGLLWKSGEIYHYDVTKTPPFAAGASIAMLTPNRAPYAPAAPAESGYSLVAGSATIPRFRAASYIPGLAIMAATDEALQAATQAFAVDDTAPNEAIYPPTTEDMAETVYASAVPAEGDAPALAGGLAVASLSGASYTPGLAITVTITVTPDAATQVYAVEDTPPLGWAVSNINNNGTFDGTNKKVKWGPFFDNSARTLTYLVTPPAGETGNKTFIGSASFDGGSVGVTGSRTLTPPPSCTYSLTTASQSFTGSGGAGSFNLTAPSGCGWTATTNDGWLLLTQASGSGNGTVNFSVAANAGTARTGTITVGGQTFTVNQSSGCAYAINPSNKSSVANGEQGSASVTTANGCAWVASSNAAWLTITSGSSGTGNGTVNFTVAANDGTARAGTLTIAGQTFTVNQAANAAPTLTPVAALTRQQGVAAIAVTIATVSDAETASGNLVVTTTSVPAGISVTALTNTNGTVSALITAACPAAVGTNTVGLKVTDAQGAAALANLTVNVTSSPSCFLQLADASASDQRTGSVLLYSYYTSSISAPSLQNTQIRITNTHETLDTVVRLYFVDGQFSSVLSLFICLPANQTANFLMSETDPGITGYVIAVAVDKTSGCPTNFNYLTGGAAIKLSAGHTANLGAVAVAALATNPTTCAIGGNVATLNFDGANYGRLPRMLVLDNLPSLKDGNNTRLILTRIGGSLVATAGALGTVSGKIYNSSRAAQDFAFSTGAPQFTSSFSINFPRLATGLDTFIPTGQSGWMRLWTDANIGILGAMINFSANLRTPRAFESGYNLQQGALSAAVSLDIPISVPTCQ